MYNLSLALNKIEYNKKGIIYRRMKIRETNITSSKININFKYWYLLLFNTKVQTDIMK